MGPSRRFRRKFHICRSAQASGLFVSARPSGYGNPLARTPERVRQDVADGLLSAERARRDYAVALTSSGSVDEAETARLRAMR
jgi:N-methylhydantoinase B/oxoprolinase/acetone carboxylase alpha subunit